MERKGGGRLSGAEVDKPENKSAMPTGSARQGATLSGVTPELYEKMVEYYLSVQEARRKGYSY